MSEYCDCKTCKNLAKYSESTEKSEYVSRFKENIAQTSKNASQVFEKITPFSEKPESDKFFRITISEFDEKTKFMREYSREIDIFENPKEAIRKASG